MRRSAEQTGLNRVKKARCDACVLARKESDLANGRMSKERKARNANEAVCGADGIEQCEESQVKGERKWK